MADKETRLKKRKSKLAKKMTLDSRESEKGEYGKYTDKDGNWNEKKFKRKAKKYTRLSDKLKKISSKSKQKDAYSVSGYKLGAPMRGVSETAEETAVSGYKLGGPTGSHMERLKSEGERQKTKKKY
jgi:hypothetical protein